MRRFLSTTILSLCLLAGAPALAKPPLWDAVVNGTNRFKVLSGFGGDAVLDRETGLVWTRSPGGGGPCDILDATWQGAHTCCLWTKVAERAGWRLPNVAELQTLLHDSQQNPALPAGHPFTGVDTTLEYWTATESVSAPGEGVIVDFATGLTWTAAKSAGKNAWCVRGPAGVERQ